MAVSVTVPALRLFAGTVKFVLPEESVCAEDVYPPPDRVTLPVGVGLTPEPATVTATLRL